MTEPTKEETKEEAVIRFLRGLKPKKELTYPKDGHAYGDTIYCPWEKFPPGNHK
jgi:hypothetical protein